MLNSVIENESTLTDRYQTTIPDNVRKALHLHKRDKIHYFIQNDGSVLIAKANKEKEDPVMDAFLSFIAKDIKKNPQNVMVLNKKLCQRIQSLVSDVEFDLEQPLRDEDE